MFSSQLPFTFVFSFPFHFLFLIIFHLTFRLIFLLSALICIFLRFNSVPTPPKVSTLHLPKGEASLYKKTCAPNKAVKFTAGCRVRPGVAPGAQGPCNRWTLMCCRCLGVISLNLCNSSLRREGALIVNFQMRQQVQRVEVSCSKSHEK